MNRTIKLLWSVVPVIGAAGVIAATAIHLQTNPESLENITILDFFRSIPKPSIDIKDKILSNMEVGKNYTCDEIATSTNFNKETIRSALKNLQNVVDCSYRLSAAGLSAAEQHTGTG